jgi:hypothetical protein
MSDFSELAFVSTYLKFGKGCVTDTLDDDCLTHIVVSMDDRSRLSSIRSKLSKFSLS